MDYKVNETVINNMTEWGKFIGIVEEIEDMENDATKEELLSIINNLEYHVNTKLALIRSVKKQAGKPETMTFKREISENGEVELTLNGEFLKSTLSKDLVGSDVVGNGAGIFRSEDFEKFHFGNFEQQIDFDTDFYASARSDKPLADLWEIISDRISLVRAWVAECKAKDEEIEVTLPA